MSRINVGAWRDDKKGPMQVVSGPIGGERVHYQASPLEDSKREMAAFLKWFNSPATTDPVLKAALAHLWFVTIHPFEDGNGRIARAIADMALARSENSAQRFYSMSAQIRLERNAYYDMLEETQKGESRRDALAHLVSRLSRSRLRRRGRNPRLRSQEGAFLGDPYKRLVQRTPAQHDQSLVQRISMASSLLPNGRKSPSVRRIRRFATSTIS